MNDLQKELIALKEKVADLESRISDEPVAKWQPKCGNFYIRGDGYVVEVDSTNKAKVFGTERDTYEKAERASVEMRRFNRLLALRDELCGDDVVDWSSNGPKYRLNFYNERGCWNASTDIICEVITPHFTSEETAQKACDMLNSGKVEL